MPIACYSRSATQEFWTEHWGGEEPGALVDIARRSPLTGLIERALPAWGVVLEAGCGLGQYVVLLRERGLPVVGTDWSGDALERCRRAFPRTPLAAMDLGTLAVGGGTISAYVSLGVLEHDPNGPSRLLREAHRVLAPGGRLIVSVPYLNGVRRLGERWLARRQRALAGAGGQFYQFVFSRREVRAFVEAGGFRVLSLTPYDPARLPRAALRRWRRRSGAVSAAAVPAARTDGASRDDRDRIVARTVRGLLYTPPMLRLFGHMILAVAVKT